MKILSATIVTWDMQFKCQDLQVCKPGIVCGRVLSTISSKAHVYWNRDLSVFQSRFQYILRVNSQFKLNVVCVFPSNFLPLKHQTKNYTVSTNKLLLEITRRKKAKNILCSEYQKAYMPLTECVLKVILLKRIQLAPLNKIFL